MGWLHELWALSRHAPTASPVSGGSLEWPKVLLQAFGVCHGEEQAISAWWQSEQASKAMKEAGNG